MKSNICCRIFREQMALINNLPEKERAIVLYTAINNALNQFDNQFDNQNENAYVSVSVSVSISEISKAVIDMLSKNIVFKEFSNNYGGKRLGAGKKKKASEENKKEKIEIKKFIKPSIDEVKGYIAEKGYSVNAERFINYYESKGWLIGKSPMKDWKAAVRTWEQKIKEGGIYERKQNSGNLDFNKQDADLSKYANVGRTIK